MSRTVALVSGHVQGVGSASLQRPAASLRGVGGSEVLLLADGRVEVVLEGPAEALRSVITELDGPRAPGRVTGVDSRDDAVQGVQGFTVL